MKSFVALLSILDSLMLDSSRLFTLITNALNFVVSVLIKLNFVSSDFTDCSMPPNLQSHVLVINFYFITMNSS